MTVASKRRTVLLSVLIVLLLAGVGFAVSLFLIPSDDSIELLISLDEQQQTAPGTPVPGSGMGLERAQTQYMNAVDAGAVTFPVVDAYSKALLEAGQQDEATAVWKTYVEQNPEDLTGWKEFARLSQLAGSEDDFLLGLKNIARLEGSEENLKVLSGYQNYKKDYAGQVETLKKLVALTAEGNPQYLLDLADIALLVEDKEAALAALNSYYTKHAARIAEEAASAVVPGSLVDADAEAPSASEAEALNADAPPPPPLPDGVVVASDAPDASSDVAETAETAETNAVDAAAEAAPKAAVAQPAYDRLPTYIRLLAQAERTEEALSEAVNHTRDGYGVEQRPAVAEALLFEIGADAAIEYIETISAQGEVPENMRAVYARALVQQGKYETALPVLKSLADQGGDYREWYFLALSAAAKSDQSARRDLVEHVRDSFAAGDLTEAQKLDRVYALLNAGEKSRALDYTERSMHAAEDEEFKGKWRELHTALTFKPKPVRVARVVPRVSLEQKLALARQSSATEDYIRKTAFELLAAKRKDDAVELFSVLAAANGPNSDDANQLIYLWGARISGPELGWVVNQAANSTPSNQAGWVTVIAEHAASEDIIAIAQAYPSWLGYIPYERRYVDALMASGNPEAVNQYISQQASGQQSVDVYHSIASKAESVMDIRSAEQALRSAAQADPSNRETWLRLTSMYTSRARYSAAEQTVANALHANNSPVSSIEAARQDVAANYYAAILAKRNGDTQEANNYFSRAVNVGQTVMLEDRDSQVKLLSSQMALGNEQAAAQGFENLLEAYPGDAVLLADYISALLDQGSYLAALDVSARHGNDVSMDNGAALDNPSPLLVRSPSGNAPLLQSMSGGRELKLVFDGPIPAGYVLYANEQAPSWVSYTTASYDTAVIAAHSGYALQAAETPDGLLVSAVPVADTTVAEAIRQRYLRLQLLYTRLELETDAIDMALERLESLAPIYQEYPEYRAYQGNAEYYAGNMVRGLNLVKRAQVGDPGNEDIRYLRRNIERFRGEHVKLDHEYRRLGDHDMQVTTLEARKQYANSIDITARLQNNFYDTDVVQRAFGGIEAIEGTAQQGEFTLAKFMDDSSIISASLYTNVEEVGVGLAYQLVNGLGTTGAYADWRKPYWDIVESVVEDGTRDRLALWHLWRPNPKWTVRIEGAGNRYHINDKSNIAQSAAIQGLVLRTLNDKQPYTAIAYGLDKEHFIGNVDRNGAGLNNKLLPLRDREIHSLSGIFYQDFSEDTNGELSLGYAVDRLGESGPAVEGRLHHYLFEEVEMQLRARYGLEAGNTDNDALSVGGYVRWTW